MNHYLFMLFHWIQFIIISKFSTFRTVVKYSSLVIFIKVMHSLVLSWTEKIRSNHRLNHSIISVRNKYTSFIKTNILCTRLIFENQTNMLKGTFRNKYPQRKSSYHPPNPSAMTSPVARKLASYITHDLEYGRELSTPDCRVQKESSRLGQKETAPQVRARTWCVTRGACWKFCTPRTWLAKLLGRLRDNLSAERIRRNTAKFRAQERAWDH